MEGFTVAATQADVRHLDVEHNLEAHLRLIAETGCDLVGGASVRPEVYDESVVRQ